jgi:hypothetical protein
MSEARPISNTVAVCFNKSLTEFTRSSMAMHSERQRRSIASVRTFSSGVISFTGLRAALPPRAVLKLVVVWSASTAAYVGSQLHVYI